MDAYSQIWLQFAFPIYVWILISLIILCSRYSITVTKLIGSNPIAVLATLLLMSYNKILNIIIEVYSSVNLDYPNDEKVTVWLKDGECTLFEVLASPSNCDHFTGPHRYLHPLHTSSPARTSSLSAFI